MPPPPRKAPDRPPPALMNRGPFAMGGAPPQKAKDLKGSARRLIRRLAPERGAMVIVVLASLVSVGLALNGPRVLGQATDIVFRGYLSTHPGENVEIAARLHVVAGEGVDFTALAETLAIVAALYVGASLFLWLAGFILTGVVQRSIKQLRADVEAKLAQIPLVYYDTHTHGEILSRVTNDIDNVGQSLQQSMSQILNALFTTIGVLVMLLVISPLLALLALVTVPISVAATAKIAKRAQKRYVAQWKFVGELNGQIEEAFTGHSLVKVLGRRREVEQRFDAKNSELYDAGFRATLLSSAIMPAVTFVGNLTYVGIAVVGGLRVASGAMLLGSVQAFIQYSRQFTQQLSQVANMASVIQSGVASAERVFELLDSPDQRPDADPPAVLTNVRGEVRFDNVSFQYKPEQPLIEKLSLVAKPGQTVAIVGPTGAGKTTLVNLLMRFYELDGGAITIDGVDIASMTRDHLRSQLGMVLQDTWLFGGSVRDNIAYGNPKATDAEIVEAAKATYVDRFVHALPGGYDTVIADDASNVSAGEKQLITIARAFLADPAILILDEATSSVDTRTEVMVQRAMAALRERRTSFVIAHRLSTIRNADLILVMEHGQIVEQGTHAELLAAHGAYFNLYTAAPEA
ncbi:MAG TPA: ABC transporter ATP-binding protein [Kofleriaceae bacterium]|jgi:ATP-binding cassette subfamily B protein|nr:ABC transporter ATP-binding protein [Kofleriaceae bacterium]